MSSKTSNPTAIVLGAALAGGLALSGSAFAMEPLAQGYMLAGASVAEGSCGANGPAAKGDAKAKEGSCGADKAKMSAASDKMAGELEAFQRHFRPERVDGIADFSTIDTLHRLLAALPRYS